MKSIQRSLTALAFAAATATGALAAPVTYAVDSTHTYPRFSYSHFGYSTQLSTFGKTTGKVVLDAEAKTASVEMVIDTKSVNTNFVAFSHYLGDIHGQVFVFFILTVAAAESAIGLAILVVLFRNLRTINVDDLDQLKG